MTDENEMRQRKVVAYVNKINELLVGCDLDEAQTALSLTIVTMLVFTYQSDEERLQAARGLTQQVCGFLQNDTVIDWVKSCMVPVHVGRA